MAYQIPEVAMAGSGPSSSGLAVEHLAVYYRNGACGVRDVSLDVQPGEIVALLGRNGAGKSSCLRGIAGFLKTEHVAVSGHVAFAGKEMPRRNPASTFRKGMALVQERDKIFPPLTVDEHLRLACGRGNQDSACSFEALDALRQRKAGHLSGGERQMLAIEMAWRSEPDLLLVDELSLGLAPIIVKELLRRLREIVNERKIGMLVVEQDAAAALRVADRAYVLRDGTVAWQGKASDTSADSLAHEYLGAVS